MLATFIIVLREVIEAGLIIGIVLAATRGMAGRYRWVGYGVGFGAIGACLVAAFAGAISDAMAGSGQEIFNATVLLTAVAMLAWHNVWMAKHGRELAAEVKMVGNAVSTGQRSPRALAIVVGAAILREGSEVVLFLYGVALSGQNTVMSMLSGGMLGVFCGFLLSALTYNGLLRIPNRYLFTVTGTLLSFLAAGMASQAVAFLQQAGVVSALAETVWDTSAFIADDSLTGKTLAALMGYTAQPTGLQLAAYVAVLGAIFAATRLVRQTYAPKTQTALP